jgi:hypothetical protein
MLTLSQGAWLQGGYNTLYGMSAGLGVNLTQKYPLNIIMKEGLVTLKLGASHEFVLAYKFKSTNYYYGDDEEEGALLLTNSAPKRLNLIQAFLM